MTQKGKNVLSDVEIVDLLHKTADADLVLKEIMRSYQRRLYAHIRYMVQNHEDADDILQNVFVKIWKALPQFKAESQLFTWAYRIATNECIGFLNQKKNRKRLDMQHFFVQKTDTQTYFNTEEIAQKLEAAVEKLPTKQKLIFGLKYHQDLPYNQIAEILDLSEGALKASYHHAVKKIERQILTSLEL